MKKNVLMKVEGDMLTITVDLSQTTGKSKSGKTILIASTKGSERIPGRDEYFGLNVYRYPDEEAVTQ